MSESGAIPITSKKTGKTTTGTTPQSSKPTQTSKLNTKIKPHSQVEHKKDIETSEQQLPEKKKNSVKKIESFEEFFSNAYIDRKPRNLKTTELKEISKNKKPSDESRKTLLESAKSDKLLGITLKILLSAVDIESFPHIKNTIRDFVRDVFNVHPLLMTLNLQNSQDITLSIKTITNKDYSIYLSTEDEKLNNKEQSSLKFNAVYCFLLLKYLTQRLPVDKVSEYLVENLWYPALLDKKNDHKTLLSFTSVKDKDAITIGLVGDSFKKQLTYERQATTHAEKSLELEQTHTKEQQNYIKKLQEELTKSNSQFEKLSNELEVEREKHKNTRMQMQDNFETLRARLLRRLKSDVSLLDDGLHALRRDPPKVHIMDDHAERAIDALKMEIKELGSENQ